MTYPDQPPYTPPWPPTPSRPAVEPPRRGPKTRTLALTAVIGAVAFTALGWYTGATWTKTHAEKATIKASSDAGTARMALLAKAVNACDTSRTGSAIADGGHTLTIDGSGKEDYEGVSVPILECMLTQLAVPEAVKSHMVATRALDGRQTDEWGGFTASWSYHPDSGLDLIIRAP